MPRIICQAERGRKLCRTKIGCALAGAPLIGALAFEVAGAREGLQVRCSVGGTRGCIARLLLQVGLPVER